MYIYAKGDKVMGTTSITNLRKNIFAMVENTVQFNEPLLITSKAGNAVMISEDDYRGMLETINITSIPGMKEKLIDGKNVPLNDTVEESDVEW